MNDSFGRLLDQALAEQVSVHLGFDNDLMSEAVKFFNLERPAKQTVIIAGSNGKGTCAHVLSQWLHRCGFRVGLIVSPHVLSYRERFLCDNHVLGDDDWNWVYQRIKTFDRYHALSFFELVVLAGFLHARHQNVDILISEVGLGGRLDATNVISHDVAILTSINLEHTAILGQTRSEILQEKIQVARPGGVFITAVDDLEQDIQFWAKRIGFKRLHVQPSSHAPLGVSADLMGSCVSAMRHLLGQENWQVPIDFWRVKIPFRSMCIAKGPVIMDTAHNAPAVSYFLSQISKSYAISKWRVIFNVRQDRDIQAVADVLEEWGCEMYLLAVPRCHDYRSLPKQLQGLPMLVDDEVIPYVQDEKPTLILGSFWVLAHLAGGSLQMFCS